MTGASHIWLVFWIGLAIGVGLGMFLTALFSVSDDGE